MFNPKGAVVQLNSSNFKKEVLDIEKPTLVAFTAPWCGHCKRLAPEYERAAESLSGVVKFANIDCDEERNKPTCGKYGIQGFPTIKMFPPTKKRIPKDYRGERTAKALADYSAGELPLAGVKKLEASNIQDFAEKDPSRVKVLLFTNKPASSALYKSLALDFRRSMSF
ncbi:thioredoxin-domain-containing protein, partial [Tilletiaria anomala UBC 951]